MLSYWLTRIAIALSIALGLLWTVVPIFVMVVMDGATTRDVLFMGGLFGLVTLLGVPISADFVDPPDDF